MNILGQQKNHKKMIHLLLSCDVITSLDDAMIDFHAPIVYSEPVLKSSEAYEI